MRKLKIFAMLILMAFTVGTLDSCTKSKKSCKASHKRVKAMRKSGQIKF